MRSIFSSAASSQASAYNGLLGVRQMLQMSIMASNACFLPNGSALAYNQNPRWCVYPSVQLGTYVPFAEDRYLMAPISNQRGLDTVFSDLDVLPSTLFSNLSTSCSDSHVSSPIMTYRDTPRLNMERKNESCVVASAARGTPRSDQLHNIP